MERSTDDGASPVTSAGAEMRVAKKRLSSPKEGHKTVKSNAKSPSSGRQAVLPVTVQLWESL